MKTKYYLLILLAGFLSCETPVKVATVFSETPDVHPVTAGVIDEASGIADSYLNPGYLWVLQDSQNPPELYLLGHDGRHGKKVFIKNVTNRDWEELALADGHLYIGEIGDNNKAYPGYFFYKIAEPPASTDTVTQVDKIEFKYPDGSHDAEAFFVEPSTKDIYIITKSDPQAKVYKLPFPQLLSSMNTAVYVMSLPFGGVTAAACRDKEVLVKTYTNNYYFPNGVQGPSKEIKYIVEPQGEAMCFAQDNSGFYTLSERGFAPSVTLNFYRRN